uniref:Reverse transcriptase domain-containing protein n=1 Tax=Acrobeloides nanus TaxID=290746 RepID=A0A914DB83_9BILA
FEHHTIFVYMENQLDLDYAPREASPLEKFEYNETEIHKDEEDGRDISTEEEDESKSKEESNENEKETNGKKNVTEVLQVIQPSSNTNVIDEGSGRPISETVSVISSAFNSRVRQNYSDFLFSRLLYLLSPKLFNSALEEVFKTLDWDDYGIKIDGERLNHLRFSDDIAIFASTVQEAELMLQKPNEASEKVGLRINRTKTKAMVTEQCEKRDMELDEEPIEFVKKEDAWLSFKNLQDVLNEVQDPKTRAHLFNSTVLPALNYGSETWILRNSDAKKLQTTQRAMERKVLGVRLIDKVKSDEIRKQTMFKDAAQDARERKLEWAEHIVRRQDNRWTTRTTFWWPYDLKRPLGRLPYRWRREMEQAIGPNWHNIAKNREEYRRRLKDLHQING